MDKKNIYEKIKSARLQRYLTNCYSLDVVENCTDYWAYDDQFIFAYDDHGVKRLIYFAKDWDTVESLIDEVGSGQYYLEFMTKTPNEYKPVKADLTASMMRLANPDCRIVYDERSAVVQYKDAVNVEIAKVRDADEINRILWSTFHTEISHLMSDDELRAKIKDGSVTVHRNESNHIDALLQADIMPKRFYINQIVNMGEKKIIHAMLLRRLEEYIKAGGKYLYAWVDSTNIASLKFHEKYGMKHDGMWSMIYQVVR